jgi:hypothetical protein
MKKLLVIDRCDKCPHFDNEYYEYLAICDQLGRKIEQHPESGLPGRDYWHPIPSDCPLEDAK